MQISNFHLGIGIPLSFHQIPSAFFDSFVTMEKPPWTYLRSSSGPVDEMRNNIVKEAISIGCTNLIMMDTDQIYHPNTIPRLLSHKLPIVGCLVYRRYPPFDPLMLKGRINQYETIKEWESDSLVEVDATGTGCLMFDINIFKKLSYPWFKFCENSNGPIGEDIGFCSDVRKKGIKIFVDTSIPAGHLSTMVVNEGTWRLYNHVKDAASKHKIEHGISIAKENGNGF